MSWWGAAPDALTLAALAVLPGALALRLLGVRGLAALAASPPVTLAAVGVLTVLFAPLGVPWRMPAVLAGLAVMLGALLALTRAVLSLRRRDAGRLADGGTDPAVGEEGGAGRGSDPAVGGTGGAGRGSDPAVGGGVGAARGAGVVGPVGDRSVWRPGPLGRRAALAVTASVVAGFVLLAVPLVTALPTADAPLQQWDAVFHLNAVVAVRETGVVTPLGGLAPLYGGGALAPYYPTGWHALVALAPGASVAGATNAALLVLGSGAWVLGLAGLARELFPRRTAPAVLAPLLAAGFVAYPVVQLTVLAQLANGLATALLPGALLLVVRGVRTVQARAGAGAAVASVLAAVAGLVGTVVAHASGAFSLAVLAGPLVVAAVGGWAVRTARSGRRALGGGALLALAAAVVTVPLVLANLEALAAVTGFARASGRSHASALVETLLDQTLVYGYPGDGWQHVAVTAATLAGAVLTLVRRRHRWVAVAWALGVVLAVLASGPEEHPLRWLSGFWYTQAGRIAPVATVPAVLLAGYALTALVDRARRASPGAGRAAVAGVLVVVLGTVALRLPLQERVVASAYVPGETAWGTMATAEELAMMRRLGDSLPDDAVVVGDPFNGSALLPAMAGVDVVFPQLGASGLSEPQRVLQSGLADLHDDPAVCAALREVGATHLYQETASAEDGAKLDDRTAGMRDVDVTTGFTEVDRAGTAAVYRIELCR